MKKTSELACSENCQLEIVLGTLKISLKDFLCLRPKTNIKFNADQTLDVKLLFLGRPWAKASLKFEEAGEINLEITELVTEFKPEKQQLSENLDYF